MNQVWGLRLLLVLSLYGNAFYAQQHKTDSILTLLKNDINDTNKVNHLNLLAREYLFNNPDTAVLLAMEAADLAEKTEIPGTGQGYKKGEAVAYGNAGTAYSIKGDYLNALDSYFKALKIDEFLKNEAGIIRHLGNIGTVYYSQKDFTKALHYYSRTLKMAEKIGDKNLIATNLGNIGLVLNDQKKFTESLEFFYRSLRLSEEMGNKSGIAAKLGNIGNVYKDLAPSLRTILEREQMLDTALSYYFRSLKLSQELGNKRGITIRLGNIGTLYTEKGRYADAEKYLSDALAIDTTIGYLIHAENTHQGLSFLYEKTDRYQAALHHYKKAMGIKDSLFNEDKNKEITRKEMNYEFEKKEAAAKFEQDKKDALSQIIIYSVSVGFILVLLLAGFIYRGFRQKKKANQLISEQKLIVEEKQKEILDSIHYAKRIQQGLLPTDRYIEKKLRELN